MGGFIWLCSYMLELVYEHACDSLTYLRHCYFRCPLLRRVLATLTRTQGLSSTKSS